MSAQNKAIAVVCVALAVLVASWLATRPTSPASTEKDVTPTPRAPTPRAPIAENPGAVSEPPAAVAQTPLPAAKAALARPVIKELTGGEKPIRFVERKYVAPIVLQRLAEPPALASLVSVEQTMASYASAMQAGDWSWWMSLWDGPGQALINQRVAQSQGRPGRGSTRDLMLAGWKEYYAGRSLELVSRVELPGYVLVYMRRSGEPDDSRDLLMPLALKRDGQQWRFTHDLREHPVYNLRMAQGAVSVRTVD